MGHVELKNVRKSYSALEVIKGVSLHINDGEFVVFVGPSGCGKSTLLRMIAGLEEITAGDIDIAGVKVNNLPPVKRGISMVFQSYALYPHMSVFENIAFPLRVEKLPQVEVTERVHKAADILKLRDRLHHRPGELSGGQRQRVAIGRAIVRNPSVFLFDEPLSNLDAALRAEMRVELNRLHSRLKSTMIFVTHDQVDAMTMADRIVVLNDGEISQVGTPLELYHKPQNTFVASFIGNPKMNFVSVKCTGVTQTGVSVELPTGGIVTVPVAPRDGLEGQTLTLGIRPEHCHLAGGDVVLDIQPSVVERLGLHTVVYASLSDGTNFSCILPGSAPVKSDTTTPISIRTADCHLFDSAGLALERDVALEEIDPPVLAATAADT